MQVPGVERARTGVAVWARSPQGAERLEADYAVLALTLPLLGGLALEWPRLVRQGLQAVHTADAIKMALETDGSWVDGSAASGAHQVLAPCGRVAVVQRIASMVSNADWIARHATGHGAGLAAGHGTRLLRRRCAVAAQRLARVGAGVGRAGSAGTAGAPPTRVQPLSRRKE